MSGLDDDNAWETIGKFTTTSVYGDRGKLKRGSIFNTQFYLGVNGTTIEDYGTGALPIINGSAYNNAVISSGNNITMRNLNLTGAINSGVYLSSTSRNWTIEYCTIQGNGQNGIQNYGTGNIFSHNDIYSNGDGVGDSGIFEYGINGQILFNTIHENCPTNDGRGISLLGNGILVKGNNVYDNGDLDVDGTALEGYGATNNLIEQNYFKGGYCVAELKEGFNNNTIQNNIFTSPSAPINPQCFLIGLDVSKSSTGNKIYHNTFIGGVNVINDNSGGNEYKNNIIIGTNGIYFYNHTGFGAWDYNCFYVTGKISYDKDTNTSYSTLTDWQATSQDSHSIVADPLLTPSYRLKPGSPAINAGTSVNVTDDYLGNPRDGQPDMGAVESGNFIKSGTLRNCTFGN